MVQPISEVIDGEDGMRPIIVQFQNSELQEGEEKKLKTRIFKKSPNKTIVAAATKNILYTGTVTKDEDNDNPYKRYLLATNRETGKVRIIAVDSAILTAQFERKNEDVADTTTISNANTSMSQLNKEFGSKKIKRITEQRERLKMNIDDVKEQLEQTVAGIQVDSSDNLVAESAENESAYRPPINRNASTREQVYDLSVLVPENVLDSLEEEANQVYESDIDTLELSSFVKQHLKQMQTSASPSIEKYKILLYIEYLIKFITTPAKNITKKFILCHSSKEVNDYILDNFSVPSNTGRTRPVSMRDKTICYILVLSMIALDYEIDVESISKNVKMGVKKLQEVGRILAFSTLSKNKNVMTLKIPLPPAISLSPKKRRKTM